MTKQEMWDFANELYNAALRSENSTPRDVYEVVVKKLGEPTEHRERAK